MIVLGEGRLGWWWQWCMTNDQLISWLLTPITLPIPPILLSFRHKTIDQSLSSTNYVGWTRLDSPPVSLTWGKSPHHCPLCWLQIFVIRLRQAPLRTIKIVCSMFSFLRLRLRGPARGFTRLEMFRDLSRSLSLIRSTSETELQIFPWRWISNVGLDRSSDLCKYSDINAQ